MEFTRLRLSGFKSFVDPTELYIEPGLTGVVGPNGCGKSNLLEALRWVMGETKPSAMRGSGMDDVIFSGTATRASRNLAEVTLLLDNSTRLAPVALNEDDQIEISRRIERESGSAYRVNGKETRARDVQLLFADMATGAHSPSLVSQGRIGALINAKPRDRASLLEEAAGISGLHSRRHEAELRLRAAETNLGRLQDVMTQIEGQLATLKKQARQAARYRTLSSRLRAAEAMMMHLRWLHATTALEAAEQGMTAIETVVRERAKVQTKASTDQAIAASKVPPLRQEESERGAAVHRLTVARESLDEEEARISRELGQLKGRLEQVGQDATREQSLVTDADKHIAELQSERDELQNNNDGHAEQLEGQQALLNEFEAAVDRNKTLADGASESFTQLSAQKTSLSQQASSLDIQIGDLDKRIQSTREQHDELAAQAQNDPAVREAAAATADTRTAADAAQANADQLSVQALQYAETEADARLAFEEARDELAPLQAEEKALTALLAESEPTGSPVLDDIKSDRGFEAALAAALGDDLSLGTDDEATAFWRGLQPLDSTPDLPAGATPLAQHIKAPAALNRIMSYIGVIDADLGDALHHTLQAGQVLVSKEGDVWRWDGKVTRAGAPSTAAVRLEQRNRLEALAGEIESLQSDVNSRETEWTEAGERAAETAAMEKQAKADLQSAQDALIAARNKEADIAQENARNSSRLQAMAETMERLQADRETLTSRKGELLSNLEELPDIDAYQRSLEEARSTLASSQEQLAETRQSRDFLVREDQQRQHRLANIERELDNWRSRKAGAVRQVEQLAERTTATANELSQLEARPDELQVKRRALEGEMAEASAARQKTANALAEAESDLAGFDKALEEAQREMADAREERVRAEGQLEQARERITDLTQRIEEDLECRPQDTLEISGHKEGAPLPDMEDTHKRLERLKRERDTMGPVNLRADQESEEIQAELDGMEKEKEDLEAAIEKLRRAINSLNREGRERLATAFTEVNEHFTDLFKRLFGGGSAHLELTESDDPLEAGLEIMASPPGKRLQAMSLLSGGEQALTALSLIFAVFMTNPAPICVLDEVDAPLDDANVERFCNLLHEISAKTGTRFLIVSHHPITMSHLHRLFGVTMGERGVSQLVSVDLDQAEELIAAE